MSVIWVKMIEIFFYRKRVLRSSPSCAAHWIKYESFLLISSGRHTSTVWPISVTLISFTDGQGYNLFLMIRFGNPCHTKIPRLIITRYLIIKSFIINLFTYFTYFKAFLAMNNNYYIFYNISILHSARTSRISHILLKVRILRVFGAILIAPVTINLVYKHKDRFFN